MNYLSIELFFIFTLTLIGLFMLLKLNNKKILDLRKEPILIAMIALLALGIFVRIISIEKYPISLDSDETNIGYDIYALANYGVDKYDMQLPVHLLGRGSGQNALYAYLSIPFVKLFGLNVFSVRIINSLVSCITLLFVLHLIYNLNIKDDKKKLIILLLAAIFPWHICKARWGLECNILPDLLFYAVYFIYLGIKNKKNRYYYISSIIFGLSIYAYGPSYLYLPIFVITTYIYLLIKKYIKFKHVLINIILILLIQLPLLSFIYINNIGGETYKFLNVFTVPKLYTNRIDDISSIKQGQILLKMADQFKRAILIIVNQKDFNAINTITGYGTYYAYSLPFVIIGILYSFRSKNQLLHMNIFALITALFVASNLTPNINRINTVWIPIYIFMIYGIIKIYESNKNIGNILSIIYIIQFVLFTNYYFTDYQELLKRYQTHEILDTLEYTKKLNYEELYITNNIYSNISNNYTYYLFSYTPNPHEWNRDVVKTGGVKDYKYLKYNNVFFYLPDKIEDNKVYIMTYEEAKKYDLENKKIKYYEDYIVIH